MSDIKEHVGEMKESYYFSGQGIVSIESEDKIYDLGNCTDLVFYKGGNFALVWEKISKNNLEFLFGPFNGTEEVNITETHKITYEKFLARKQDKKARFTLHFRGVNTADFPNGFPREFKIRANIDVDFVDCFACINDELAHFITRGNWFNLEYMIPVKEEGKPEEKREEQYTIKVLDRKEYELCMLLDQEVTFVVTHDQKAADVYGIESLAVFNPSFITTIKPKTFKPRLFKRGEKSLEGSIVTLLDGSKIEILKDVETIYKHLRRREELKREKEEKTQLHKESRTGLRLYDFKLER